MTRKGPFDNDLTLNLGINHDTLPIWHLLRDSEAPGLRFFMNFFGEGLPNVIIIPMFKAWIPVALVPTRAGPTEDRHHARPCVEAAC